VEPVNFLSLGPRWTLVSAVYS